MRLRLCIGPLKAGLLLGVWLVLPGTAQAGFIPASGPGTGAAGIEHAVYALGPGGALPVFAPPFLGLGQGQMQQPGGGYPRLVQPPVFQVDTGVFPILANVPYSLVTPPVPPAGFGGASTTLIGVGFGGRAGLAATNYTVFDAAVNGFASTNTFGAQGDYVNVGPGFVATFGHFLSGFVFAAPGGYVAAGVATGFDIDFQGGVGLFFTPDLTLAPQNIVMAFDGVGVGRVEILDADFLVGLVVNQELTFGAVSLTAPVFIPAGASVRMRSTVTLVADPGSFFDVLDFPEELLPHLPDLGLGVARNADGLLSAVPEPGAAALCGLGCFGLAVWWVTHRRGRSHAPAARG